MECPYCGQPVSASDTQCPYCHRDL
ncbi:zinc ribbon domain-containing protein [Levilactobacillus brevis]|nr:zinc-ribbon domain-containing protein [Levilactobacillus brevis]MBU7540800.1 zinc-ribbon domain-containing protein [Levilactobacillus brevis]MBU7560130.1 zinc-ribbon domain-containing protein [Levilactobacillus brevis]MBU7566962.1 zinc-ribbon domain-containing protein [Levilactobacillus brevis]MCE6023760.1 zinc-ribbon domain-containing protein [Levilactobacillus brevis]